MNSRERRSHVLSNAEIERILAAAETAEDQLVLTIATDTGMRIREIASDLCIERIDCEQGIAELADTKSRRRRVVALSARVRFLLRTFIENSGRTKGQLLGITPRALSRRIKILLSKVGLSKVSPNAFRTTLLCRWAQMGQGPGLT